MAAQTKIEYRFFGENEKTIKQGELIYPHGIETERDREIVDQLLFDELTDEEQEAHWGCETTEHQFYA